MKTHRVQVFLTDDMLAWCRKQAKKGGESVSRVVRLAVHDAMVAEKRAREVKR